MVELKVVVSEQRLYLIKDGEVRKSYPVSTSKHGLGEWQGSLNTPRGRFEICEKIGEGKASGAVLERRIPTAGGISKHPERIEGYEELLTSRILRLSGLEPGVNLHWDVDTRYRGISIHGTPYTEELGSVASHGGIRMSDKDVIDLFSSVQVGTMVRILRVDEKHVYEFSKLISVDDLLLDHLNVRFKKSFNQVKSEQDAIRELTHYEHISSMAMDIARDGLNPLEMIGVIPHKFDKYIVVEGNRRICALKLMLKPAIGNSASQKGHYSSIASNASVVLPTKVECKVFESRDECYFWMKKKHVRNYRTGIKKWLDFSQSVTVKLHARRLAAQLRHYASETNLLTKSEESKVSELKVALLLENMEIRKWLGITSEKDLEINIDIEIFRNNARKLLLDSENLYSHEVQDIQHRALYSINYFSSTRDLGRRVRRSVSLVREGWQTLYRHLGIVPEQWDGEKHTGTDEIGMNIQGFIEILKYYDYRRYGLLVATVLRNLIEHSFKRYVGEDDLRRRYPFKDLYTDVIKKLKEDVDEPHFTDPLKKALNNECSVVSFDVMGGWVHGRLKPISTDIYFLWKYYDRILVKVLQLSEDAHKSPKM